MSKARSGTRVFGRASARMTTADQDQRAIVAARRTTTVTLQEILDFIRTVPPCPSTDLIQDWTDRKAREALTVPPPLFDDRLEGHDLPPWDKPPWQV